MNNIVIIAVLIFLIIPFAFFPYIMVSYTNVNMRRKKRFCFGMAFFWGIAAYRFINPATDPDLVRYIEILEKYKDRSLIESFNLEYSNLFSVDIYFHFISKLNDVQLLPAISTFIVYSIIFYILADYKIRNEIYKEDFLTYVLFTICCVMFAAIVNGIRWPLSFFIFLLAVYREIVQEKKKFLTIILYVIALFFHFSTLAFLAMRLVLVLKNKKIVIPSGILILFIPNLITTFAPKLYGVSSNNFIISNVIYFIIRANTYLHWSTDEEGWAKQVANSGYFKFENAFYWIISIIFAFIIFKCVKKNGDYFNKMNTFVFYTLIVTICSFFMAGHIYIRFITPLIVIFGVVYFDFAKIYSNCNIKKIINICLLACCAIGTVANLYYLNSMMRLKDYIPDVITYGLLRYILGKIGIPFFG